MIKAGDLVMVVWGCCAEQRKNIGNQGMVNRVACEAGQCPSCGYRAITTIVDADTDEDGMTVPVAWLIKLDPPGVTTEKRETVEA